MSYPRCDVPEHDALEAKVAAAEPLVAASPCHCIGSGGLHQTPMRTYECARCRWLRGDQ